MIRWYGRKDLGTGILLNQTDGGDGTRNLSTISCDKIRKSRYRALSEGRGQHTWKGQKLKDILTEDEYNLRMKQSMKGAIGDKRKDNWTGKFHTELSKEINRLKHIPVFLVLNKFIVIGSQQMHKVFHNNGISTHHKCKDKSWKLKYYELCKKWDLTNNNFNLDPLWIIIKEN